MGEKTYFEVREETFNHNIDSEQQAELRAAVFGYIDILCETSGWP